MQASNELLTIAELAIGLAGFSGVVVAFAHQGQLTIVDRWRFAGLLSLSMGAAVVAFVPSLLDLAGFSGESLWRASSVIFLIIAVPYAAIFPLRVFRLSREMGSLPPKPFLFATFSFSGLNLTTQLCNAAGWPYSPNPVLFLFGLVAWLVIASLFFALLVLSRPSS